MVDSNFLYGAHTAFQRYAEGSQTNAGLAVDGSLKVCVGLPPRYELAKAGRLYVASSGAATAQASTATVPTTTAPFALWNGNSTGIGGLSLVILEVSFWTFSGTFGIGAALLGGVSTVVQASAVSALASSTVKSASASARTTGGILGANITLAGAPSWMCLGSAPTTGAAANLGMGTIYKTDGGFIVPPGFCFGVGCVTTQTSSPLFGCSILYAEVESYLV